MDSNYLSIANSTLLFFICLIPVMVAFVQSFLFLRHSWKEAKKIGISKDTRKRIAINSAVFSIIPSLPILITLAVMMPSLGKYIPWLRLSVIGSAMYESLAADTTIKTFGFSGLGVADITPSIFASVIWVMTLGILLGPVLNVFFLKSYDKKVKGARSSGGFMALGIGSLFVGMLAIMGVPRLFDFENPTGIVTTICAGLAVLFFGYLAKKTKIRAINEFSFPLSMVVGMVSAVIFSLITG